MAATLILEPTETEGSEFQESGRVQIFVNMPNGAAWASRTVKLQAKSPHAGDTDIWVDTDAEWTADEIISVWIAEDLTYRLTASTAGPHASYRRIWNHTK